MERTWHFWTTRAQAPLTHNLCHWSGGWAGFAFQLNHRKQRDLDVQPGVIPSSLMGSTRLCGRLKPPGEGDLHPPVRNNEGLFQQGKEIKNGERNNDFLIMVLPNHSWSTLKILLPMSTQSCRSYQWVSHRREPLGKLLNTSLQIGQNLAFLPPQPESLTVWTEREFPSLTCKPNTS